MQTSDRPPCPDALATRAQRHAQARTRLARCVGHELAPGELALAEAAALRGATWPTRADAAPSDPSTDPARLHRHLPAATGGSSSATGACSPRRPAPHVLAAALADPLARLCASGLREPDPRDLATGRRLLGALGLDAATAGRLLEHGRAVHADHYRGDWPAHRAALLAALTAPGGADG